MEDSKKITPKPFGQGALYRSAKPHHIEKLLHLVRQEANMWAQVYPDILQDAIAEGYMRVYECLRQFETAEHTTHSSFYSQYMLKIASQVQAYVCQNFSAYTLDSKECTFFNNYWKYRIENDCVSAHPLTDEQVDDILPQVWGQLKSFYQFFRLEALMLNVNGCKSVSTVVGNQDVEAFIDQKFLERKLEKILKNRMFDTRQIRILVHRFWYDKTYDEVGIEEHVSRERIRQIEFRTLRQIRHPKNSSQLFAHLSCPKYTHYFMGNTRY